jgi:hypothetical protein
MWNAEMAGGDHLFEAMKPVTGPERELLFCVASVTEWERTNIMDAAVTSMVDSGLLMPDAAGRLVLTKQGQEMLWTVLCTEYYTQDIGGGLLAWIVDRTDAHWNIDLPGNTTLHWNINIPGSWRGNAKLPEKGRNISSKFGPSGSGVYRLIGLDGARKEASLDRICGCDRTGTLYIGCFENGYRISQLVRSLRPSGRRRYSRSSDEHTAGQRLRGRLSERFPSSHLAINWCHTAEYKLAEALLLDAYEESFGEDPPLNRR